MVLDKDDANLLCDDATRGKTTFFLIMRLRDITYGERVLPIVSRLSLNTVMD